MKYICVVLTASLLPFATQAQGYQCSGTEPFWSMVIEKEAVTLTDHADMALRFAPMVSQQSRNDGRVQVLRHDRTDGPDVVIALEENKSCSDGMSDKTYDFRIVYSGPFYDQRSAVLAGCCTRGQ